MPTSPQRKGFDRSMFMGLANQRVQALAAERPGRNRWVPPDADYLVEFTDTRYGTFVRDGIQIPFVALSYRIAEGEYLDQTFDHFMSLDEAALPFAASAFSIIYPMGQCPEDMLEAIEGLPAEQGAFLMVRVQRGSSGFANIYVNQRAETATEQQAEEPTFIVEEPTPYDEAEQPEQPARPQRAPVAPVPAYRPPLQSQATAAKPTAGAVPPSPRRGRRSAR